MDRPLPPARLSVILAREAPTAVVLRRGPSKVVGTFGWNRHDDTISVGQWLKGRIYEDACDLSLDGKYFLYSAMNGKAASETKGEWTALSFTPYLKAIGLWRCPRAFGGGGLFLDNTDYWLYGDESQILVRMETYGHKLRRLGDDAAIKAGINPRDSAESARLARNGWTLTNVDEVGLGLWEKEIPLGWKLHRGYGLSWPDFWEKRRQGLLHKTHLLMAPNGALQQHPDWSWADWDGVQNRLVWASRGQLFAAPLVHDGLGDVKLIHDFNQAEFQPIDAPY